MNDNNLNEVYNKASKHKLFPNKKQVNDNLMSNIKGSELIKKTGSSIPEMYKFLTHSTKNH